MFSTSFELCFDQDIFDQAKFKAAVGQEKCYVAAGNMWWLDHMWCATPGVPMSIDRVKELGKFQFQRGPTFLILNVHVYVDSCEFDVLARKGSLWRISPEENTDAVIFHVSDRIDAGATDEELIRWKTIFLSVCFRFESLGGEDETYWRAMELRQMQSSVDDAVRRTAMQTCYEVSLFKERKEQELGRAMTAKDIKSLYTAKALIANSNKAERDDSWVETCLLIKARILSDVETVGLLSRLESQYGLASCLNSISKLLILSQKTDTVDHRRWVLHCLCDALDCGHIQNESITKVHFSGGVNQTSSVAIYVFRREVLDYYLDIELPKSGYDVDDLTSLRKPLCSHICFRKLCQGFEGGPPADVTWQAKLKPASLLALRLLEDGWHVSLTCNVM